MSTTIEQLEKLNREKYGDRKYDVISEGYRIDVRVGHAYCALNIKKYLKRFVSNNAKSNNLVDLYKSRDYLNRMIEKAELDPNAKKPETVEK